jgi:hypothetical protein
MRTVRVRRGYYASETASGDAVPDAEVESLRAVRAVVERLDR